MYKIGIVGAKNSGKTTLIEKMISTFSKKNLKIMTIKHTPHQHSFDTKGKDSNRHRSSGAELTMAVNPVEFALFSDNNNNLINIIEDSISNKYDLCLVEGDKFSNIPKILLTRNLDKIETDNISNVCATYGEINLNKTIRHFYDSDIEQLCSYIVKESSNTKSESKL
jgi:molybdopterin-guanine dinucleotide biosynthesis protein B